MAQTFFELDFERPTRPGLTGSRTYDAAVIGAGYAGISAAQAFADRGMSVIVLERGHVGAGASGRNGGILLLSEGTHLAEARDSSVVDDSLGAVAGELVTFIRDNDLDVDLRRGTLRLAITGRQARSLHEQADAGSDRARAGREFLSGPALEQHVRSDRYTAGLWEPENITLDPLRLLEGLAVRAAASGVVIAEQSEVVEIRCSGDGITVVTSAGQAAVGRLVVAAGAGTGGVVPTVRKRLCTVFSQIGVTEPLHGDLLESVLPLWTATSEIATFSRYFRRLPGNRLLFGISTLFDSVAGPGLERRIRAELRDTFPSLGDVPLDHAWEGVIASTVEETPLLERIAPTAVVTSSNGVLPSWGAGRIAAAATAPEYAAYDRLRVPRHRAWPPFGVPDPVVRRAARAYFRLADRR